MCQSRGQSVVIFIVQVIVIEVPAACCLARAEPLLLTQPLLLQHRRTTANITSGSSNQRSKQNQLHGAVPWLPIVEAWRQGACRRAHLRMQYIMHTRTEAHPPSPSSTLPSALPRSSYQRARWHHPRNRRCRAPCARHSDREVVPFTTDDFRTGKKKFSRSTSCKPLAYAADARHGTARHGTAQPSPDPSHVLDTPIEQELECHLRSEHKRDEPLSPPIGVGSARSGDRVVVEWQDLQGVVHCLGEEIWDPGDCLGNDGLSCLVLGAA
jgi:hypothetical protein